MIFGGRPARAPSVNCTLGNWEGRQIPMVRETRVAGRHRVIIGSVDSQPWHRAHPKNERVFAFGSEQLRFQPLLLLRAEHRFGRVVGHNDWCARGAQVRENESVSYTHLRAHETAE